MFCIEPNRALASSSRLYSTMWCPQLSVGLWKPLQVDYNSNLAIVRGGLHCSLFPSSLINLNYPIYCIPLQQIIFHKYLLKSAVSSHSIPMICHYISLFMYIYIYIYPIMFHHIPMMFPCCGLYPQHSHSCSVSFP